ncbi:hypothetical protein ACEPPC_20415 [Cronobacter malonaticus]|uniref:hypothetical protein n=1 Tax=Cronobacter malonaticus TaxID=413503 RepID=UPI000CFB928C|nr:hypothetical protein [Cronobacter malonaticus]
MFSSIKEALSSAVTTASQRVRNPVFGAFVLSWCAFNWKQILYLFFSDKGIYNKIEYISANSNWSFNLILPVVSALAICIVMPWANNIIALLQSKPLDISDDLENRRKTRQILRDTRFQRYRAKRDIAYDQYKTGAEKDIQSMKEEITQSKNRMGELTSELDASRKALHDATNIIEENTGKLKKLGDAYEMLFKDYETLKEDFSQYRHENPPITVGRGIFNHQSSNIEPLLEKNNNYSHNSGKKPDNNSNGNNNDYLPSTNLGQIGKED